MSKKNNDQNQVPEETKEETPEEVTEASQEKQESSQEEALQQALREQEDKYLRLLAEYDNYRKRSQKEKENADEAYAKGVQMTMTQLKTVLEKLGVEEIPAQGESFDPNVHNAVMHMEDEALEENTVVEVFQAGFKMGEKVIRHAMVKVAN